MFAVGADDDALVHLSHFIDVAIAALLGAAVAVAKAATSTPINFNWWTYQRR